MTKEELIKFYENELKHAKEHMEWKDMPEDYYSYYNDVVESSNWAIETLQKVKAKWVDGFCSNCGYDGFDIVLFRDTRYCPRCGAEMEDEIEI